MIFTETKKLVLKLKEKMPITENHRNKIVIWKTCSDVETVIFFKKMLL